MPFSKSLLVMPVAAKIARHTCQRQHLARVNTHVLAARQLLLAAAAILFIFALDLVTRQQATLYIAVQCSDHRGCHVAVQEGEYAPAKLLQAAR